MGTLLAASQLSKKNEDAYFEQKNLEALRRFRRLAKKSPRRKILEAEKNRQPH